MDMNGSEFYGCSNLKNIVLPSNLTTIGTYSFAYCDELVRISIPKSVTSIESNAFINCTKLSLSDLPENITDIGSGAFKNCVALNLDSLPKCLKRIESKAFEKCLGISIIAIPDGVESIGESAFTECTGIKSITLPSSLNSIGAYAFKLCPELTHIEYYGDGLKSLGYRVFYADAVDQIDTEVLTNNRLLSTYNWKTDNRKLVADYYIVSYLFSANERIRSVQVDINGKLKKPNIESKSGYTISSWYVITSDGIEKDWDFKNDVVTYDMDLYARLVPYDYSVSFDSNRGDDLGITLTVTYGSKYGELPELNDNKGLSFKGWYTKATGGELITADTIVNIAENHTLYAHWENADQDNKQNNRETCEKCQSEMIKIVNQAYPISESRRYLTYYRCKVCGDEWTVFTSFCPRDNIYFDLKTDKLPTEDEYGIKYYDSCFGWYVPYYIEFASVKLNMESIDLNVGDETTISADVLPNKVIDQKLEWVSSNDSIATVDENGHVIAKSEGRVNITVKLSGSSFNESGSCVLTVKEIEQHEKAETQETASENNTEQTKVVAESDGLASNQIIKDSVGTTYKVSVDATTVSVMAVPNKKSVTIDSEVSLNGKSYPIVEICGKAISGKKVQNVTIAAKNLKKVNKNAFKGAKKLKKITIKGGKKNAKISKQIEKAARKVNKKSKVILK
nr:leucine-rich repeat protein [Butyrivibrio sp. WCD3002]